MVLLFMLVLYWRQWYNLQILQKRKDRLWTSLVTAFLLPRKAAVKKVPNKLLWTWEALKIPTIEKQWMQFFKYSPMCFPSCEIWPYCTWGKCVMGTDMSTKPEKWLRTQKASVLSLNGKECLWVLLSLQASWSVLNFQESWDVLETTSECGQKYLLRARHLPAIGKWEVNLKSSIYSSWACFQKWSEHDKTFVLLFSVLLHKLGHMTWLNNAHVKRDSLLYSFYSELYA